MSVLTSTLSHWAVLGRCTGILAELSSSGSHVCVWMFTISYGPKGQNERKLLEEKAALCHLLCLFCILTARKDESRTNGQEDKRRPAEQMRGGIVWYQVRGRAMPQRALKLELGSRRELHLPRSLFTLAQFCLKWPFWSSYRHTQS